MASKAHSEKINNIPEELRSAKRWFLFNKLPDPKRPEKKPSMRPCISSFATAEDKEANLRTVDELMSRPAADGIAYVTAPDDGLIFIDLDHVRDADSEETQPWAQDVIDDLDTYTEISGSGTGYHIVCRGKRLPKDIDKPPCEIYSGERRNKPITFTGNLVDPFHGTIEDRQDKVEQLYKRAKAGTIDKPKIDWRE